MTRKPTTPIVYSDDLPKSGLEYLAVDVKRQLKFFIKANAPHAIVRDRKTGADLGIVLYEKENGLPYAKYSNEAEYLFWGYDVSRLRARRISDN